MSEEKRVVVRRSPEEWRVILARFERSGQSHREFCLVEELAPSTFWCGGAHPWGDTHRAGTMRWVSHLRTSVAHFRQ